MPYTVEVMQRVRKWEKLFTSTSKYFSLVAIIAFFAIPKSDFGSFAVSFGLLGSLLISIISAVLAYFEGRWG
jgi:hypothetical protein